MNGAARFPAGIRGVFLPRRPEKRAAVNANTRIARQDARFPKLAVAPSAQVPARHGCQRTGCSRWHAVTADKTILHFRKPSRRVNSALPYEGILVSVGVIETAVLSAVGLETTELSSKEEEATFREAIRRVVFIPETGRIKIEFQPGADAAEDLEGQVSGRV